MWFIDEDGDEVTNMVLIEWYMKGFNDELTGSSTVESDNPLENEAYQLGAQHALMGDDLRSVDELSRDEILNMIRESNSRTF